METVVQQQNSAPFVERRAGRTTGKAAPERRQFSASVSNVNPAIAELSEAVDQYKLRHRRRFITFEELYNVMTGLGYHK